jgi:hypothetical protein
LLELRRQFEEARIKNDKIKPKGNKLQEIAQQARTLQLQL